MVILINIMTLRITDMSTESFPHNKHVLLDFIHTNQPARKSVALHFTLNAKRNIPLMYLDNKLVLHRPFTNSSLQCTL